MKQDPERAGLQLVSVIRKSFFLLAGLKFCETDYGLRAKSFD